MGHREGNAPMEKYGGVQVRKSVGHHRSAQPQRTHEARREHRHVSRVAEGQCTLQRGEELDPERRRPRTPGRADHLSHLKFEERFDEGVDRVSHPIKHGREYLIVGEKKKE
jgi:hypothetical protein